MANNTAPAAAEPQKYLGVAIFDFSDNGLAALRWAYDFGITLPQGYKLCVIRIRQVPGLQPPCERTGRCYEHPCLSSLSLALIVMCYTLYIYSWQTT
jgi:hypothetical protein